MKKGTKFFVNHGTTNDRSKDKSSGEVVKTFLHEDNGKLAAVAVGIIKDPQADSFDVCSVESDVEIEGEYVTDVNETTAIALGSSDKDSPAFAGAQRMATIQCFGEEHKKDEEGDKPVTFQEVQQAIKDMNIMPWQVFSLDDIKQDRNFGKVFEENEQLKKEKEGLEKDLEDTKSKLTESESKSLSTDAKDRFEKMIPEGTTDKQKEFLLKQFDSRKPEKLDDESLKGFLDTSIKDYSDFAKVFGIDVDDKSKDTKPSGDDDSSTPGGETEVEAVMAAMDKLS